MKKYDFKYSSLKKYRDRVEKENKVLLLKKIFALKSMENFLQKSSNLEKSYKELYANLGEENKEAAAANFKTIWNFICFQKSKQREIKKEYEIKKTEVEKSYNVYLRSKHDKKVTEVLDEKEYRWYKKNLSKKHKKEIDELYVVGSFNKFCIYRFRL